MDEACRHAKNIVLIMLAGGFVAGTTCCRYLISLAPSPAPRSGLEDWIITSIRTHPEGIDEVISIAPKYLSSFTSVSRGPMLAQLVCKIREGKPVLCYG